MKKIAFVVPCYNEADNVVPLYTAVTEIMRSRQEYEYELLYIDNASTDGTESALRQIAAKDKRVKVIFNARNFGYIRSPFHGMLQAVGDAAILMGCDFQDPPELIPKLIDAWSQGAKAVVAIKDSSDESGIVFFLRKMYYWVVEKLADIRTYQNFTGFGLYDKSIVDYCRALKDPYPYFRGIIADIGLPTTEIHFHQPARSRGLSKNNFYTLYDIAMLGITNHSTVPLRLAAMAGFCASIVCLALGVVYLVYKLLFWQKFVVGTAPLVIGLFFFASVQLFFIGVLGEYIGSIHTRIRQRPLVVEKERLNC